jgi:hypothetical protein
MWICIYIGQRTYPIAFINCVGRWIITIPGNALFYCIFHLPWHRMYAQRQLLPVKSIGFPSSPIIKYLKVPLGKATRYFSFDFSCFRAVIRQIACTIINKLASFFKILITFSIISILYSSPPFVVNEVTHLNSEIWITNPILLYTPQK